MGTLYVIGTPIGNMEDITLRQLETFRNVDFICAEDTRVTLKLLSRYDIHKPLVSYHEHSGREVADRITERILNGENAGIVTDAGMPCISDPGENLVKICYEKNIDVKVVPGPSAVVSALAVSGLNTSRFTFEGFLSVTKKQRFDFFRRIKKKRKPCSNAVKTRAEPSYSMKLRTNSIQLLKICLNISATEKFQYAVNLLKYMKKFLE